jgi:TolB-like protein/tetratricopeptide (TPR) repeat protein
MDSLLPVAFTEALAGRYTVLRELGAGGMARVFVACDLAHDRDVALKVLSFDLDETAIARFQREIRVVAALAHPRIVPLFDSGIAAGHPWFTMPYVVGESLRDRLRREGALPITDAVRISDEVGEALSFAHRHGVLHRDVKPENILLSDGGAGLADFGIARALGGDGADRLTATGLSVGTVAYMSPEQSDGQQPIDARSDVYALACVTYEMLTGEVPFSGPTAHAILARRLTQDPPSARIVRPAISAALNATLHRALALVPADRHASVEEFRAALRAAALNSETSTPLVNTDERRTGRPRRLGMIAGLVATVVLIAVAIFAVRDRHAKAAAPAADSIRLAVLPFRSVGPDSADRIFTEGLAEEISATLANIGGLRVIAQTAVEAAARGGRSPHEIAREVRANSLVTGEVQRVGDVVRVRVRFVDPVNDVDRWTQVFEHPSRDVLRVHSEVALRVADVFRIQLAEGEANALRRPPTTDPVAYGAYLRAKRIQGGGRRSRDSAVVGFTSAVTRDSTFALAFAHRAIAYANLAFSGEADKLELAERDIRRALALDSTIGLAWTARGNLAWNAERGWHPKEAIVADQRGILLQPSAVGAHNEFGALLIHYGFNAEARREFLTSLALDPTDSCSEGGKCSPFARFRLARIDWYEQHFDSAVAKYSRISDVSGHGHDYARARAGLGRVREALAVVDTTSGMEPADRAAIQSLLLAMLGDREAALRAIAIASRPPTSRSHYHHAQYYVACAYARLGMKTEAVDWLTRAADNGFANYPLFRSDPELRPLRGDNAFEALMVRVRQQYDELAVIVRAGER